jgi:transposase
MSPTKNGPSSHPTWRWSARTHPKTHPRPPAHGLRRPALDRTCRSLLAHAATRFPAGKSSTSRPGGGGFVLGSSRRWSTISEGAFAAGLRPHAQPDGGDPRQPHLALFARKRPPLGLRRCQTQEGFEGACAAVDTLGHLLALHVTAADEQDRAQVEELAKAVQEATDESVELAYVDQGYIGEQPAEAAEEHGIRLGVVKQADAKRGFVLVPRRWVVERDFAWASRFRRLVKD